MSQAIESPPSQSPKLMIATALITALTTIGVSFIGVVPQLRGRDSGVITSLEKTVADLKAELDRAREGAAGGKAPSQPPATKTVAGKVLTEDGKPLRNGVDVYLLPEDNGLPTTQADDNGEFIFRDVPPVHYLILVREKGSGMSGLTRINAQEAEVKVKSGLIQYVVTDKGGR